MTYRTQENLSRAVDSPRRPRGVQQWARGRAMYERFSRHLKTVPLRAWNLLNVEEQIAWRELAKCYRSCVYNTKGCAYE